MERSGGVADMGIIGWIVVIVAVVLILSFFGFFH
jgi:hypothetical protein